jgi:hypothetical protein
MPTKNTDGSSRKTRVVLADENRHTAAREYLAANTNDQKARVLRKWNVSRGAVSGWIQQGYGAAPADATHRRTRSARGTEPPANGAEPASERVTLPPLAQIVLAEVQHGAIEPAAAEKLLAAIFRAKA